MILTRPPSSRAILLNDGTTAVSSCITIVALMYGMMVNAPMAQFSVAPPLNILIIPSGELVWAWICSKNVFNAAPSSPGTRTHASNRQIAGIIMVNKIRDLSSGILKQLLKVWKIDASMNSVVHPQLRLGLSRRFGTDDFARSAFCLDLGTR